MKRTLLILTALLALSLAAAAQPGYVPAPENLAAREKFQDARFGIFIHWGIYSMKADGEWSMNLQKIPYDEYQRFAGGFYPSKFNAEEWVKTFKAAGARYMTITSRHHDGFSMFKSNASSYNIVDATPFKRDVIGELAAACAKEDFTLNFYYSHLDWVRQDYWPRGMSGNLLQRPDGDENSWGHYIDFICAQLTELLTQYGPIGCIWFDGMWDKHKGEPDQAEVWQLARQYELIHRLQPACLIGNNHHLPIFEGEDIQIFEKDVPGKNTAGFSGTSKVSENVPLETCQTIYHSWGYDINDYNYKSADQLIQFLVQTAGKGANLLLNVGPRPDGTLPEESVKRLLAIGKWLETHGETIYGTDGGCVGEQYWGVTTQTGKTLYVHVLNPAEAIFVPFKGNKLVSAVSFEDGTKVPFSQVAEGIVLTLPARPEACPDQIITLTFKNEL